MTKRFQVLFEDEELREFQSLARRHGMTTAAWVRRTLRAARDAEVRADVAEKLAAIRTAATYAFPTADIEEMLGDLERGDEGAVQRTPSGSTGRSSL